MFSRDDGLTLPHPLAHQRAFVLIPWLAVDPDARSPWSGERRPVDRLLAELEPADRDGVRLTGLVLNLPASVRRLMGPTRKRDLAAAVVGVAILAYLLVHVLYRYFPPITLWTGLSLLAVAAAEAAWGVSVRSRIRDGEIGVGGGRLHPLAVARTSWWPKPRPGWAR